MNPDFIGKRRVDQSRFQHLYCSSIWASCHARTANTLSLAESSISRSPSESCRPFSIFSRSAYHTGGLGPLLILVGGKNPDEIAAHWMVKKMIMTGTRVNQLSMTLRTVTVPMRRNHDMCILIPSITPKNSTRDALKPSRYPL